MNDPPAKENISPKEMLRATRPERFSDSKRLHVSTLDRSTLEYHLHTLTSRNQETEFERFAFALCKLEICPNLRPQTGPTGGGDSKADSETFPLSKTLTFSWIVGDESSSERWAFAFSAKADCLPKLKSDVKKLSDTKRDYKRVYFVSNQTIPDKKRAEVEDQLSQKYRFKVTVLDRTWILDRVFGNNREKIAIDELKIEAQSNSSIVHGPLDVERTQLLDELNARVATDVEEGLFTLELAEKCSQVPILARELERPREEIEGFFRRSERIARKVGSEAFLKKVSYDQAWTAFWYFEDFEEFDLHYTNFENLVNESENLFDIERLNTLCTLFRTVVPLGEDSELNGLLSQRLITVAENLQRIKGYEGRPTASLHASALLILQEIVFDGLETNKKNFANLRSILSKSQHLVGFPLSSILNTIFELEEYFGDDEEFEKLSDLATEISSSSVGDSEFAYSTARRGSLKLEKGLYFDAVKLLGKSVIPFSNNNTRSEFISVLNLLGYAYERIGLYWAARAAYLHAASHAMRQFETYSEPRMAIKMVSAIGRLKWIELVLGRPVEAICFFHQEYVLWNLAAPKKEQIKKVMEDHVNFDFVLCILLMRSVENQLQLLTKLPNALRNFDLECSRLGVLHALGHPPGESKLSLNTAVEADDYFSSLQHQPAGTDLPNEPILNAETAVHFSKILGASIRVTSAIQSPYFEFAESILANLESIFSTAREHKVFAVEPQVEVEILKTDKPEISQIFSDSPNVLKCSIFLPESKLSDNSKSSQEFFMESCFKAAGSIGIRVFNSTDSREVILKLLDSKNTMDRVFYTTMSFVVLENILGEEYPKAISELISENEDQFPVKRSMAWKSSSHPEETQPPADASHEDDYRTASHKDLTSDSLIRPVAWAEAEWQGALFGTSPDHPPIIGLIFGNRVKGESIFSVLNQTLGAADEKNRLRVVIVNGIQNTNPNAYRITLIPSLKSFGSDRLSKYIQVHVRGKTLEPTTNENLTLFLNSFAKFEYYFLTSSSIPQGSSEPQFSYETCIGKSDLSIRQAWEIGLDDEDSMAISPDDDPFVPPGITNPPVEELLKELRQS